MSLDFGSVFTNVLFLAGFIGGFISPYFGLMVFYAFSILRPTFLWFWAPHLTQRHSFYLGISLLLGWALSGGGDWSHLRGFWLKAALWGLVVYLASGAMAAWLFAVHPPYAWQNWMVQFKILLVILLTISIVREPGQIRTFAWVVTASLGYLAWVFNSQYYFDQWNRILTHGFGAVDNNGAAMIMVVGVPLAFFMGIYDKRFWVKILCFAAALALIHVVFFSFSRGGMLGLCMVGAATFVVALFHLPNKALTIAIAVGFVIASLQLAGRGVRNEFFSIFVDQQQLDASAASRFLTWGAAWRCMLDNPLGVGPRNFIFVCRNYGLGAQKSVHNLFLQTGADYGFIGMFGLFSFYFGSIISCYLMSQSPTAKKLNWPRYFGQMVSISLAGFVISSMFVGMEAVEAAYIIAILGLCTVAYVNRVAMLGAGYQPHAVIELDEVPDPNEEPEAWQSPEPLTAGGYRTQATSEYISREISVGYYRKE